MPNTTSGKITPVNEPVLSRHARTYVMECVKTGWISSADMFIGRFEDAYAPCLETKLGVAYALRAILGKNL